MLPRIIKTDCTIVDFLLEIANVDGTWRFEKRTCAMDRVPFDVRDLRALERFVERRVALSSPDYDNVAVAVNENRNLAGVIVFRERPGVVSREKEGKLSCHKR